MVRRVAFKKAVLGGVLGAFAWEVVVRILISAGFNMLDLVRILGTLAFGGAPPVWQWWPAGMLMHAAVGSIWAIFYAYFFWSMIDVRPVFQGLLFSFLPALLAGLVMIPQMDLMLNGAHPPLGVFATALGAAGPVAVVLGHLIYGATLGATYTNPVGYPVGKRVVYG